MSLPTLKQYEPPIAKPPVPLLNRWFAAAGPPSVSAVEAAGATVVAMPTRFGVTYVLAGPESLVVLDAGSVTDLPRIEAVVNWLGKPVSHILPTHLHFDHIMGVDTVARCFGVSIALSKVAHDAVTNKERLPFCFRVKLRTALSYWLWQGLPLPAIRDFRRGLGFGFPWSRNQFRSPIGPALGDGDPIPGLPGWQLLEAPGHSPDGICLFHPEGGLLVAGDVVLNFCGGEWNRATHDPQLFARTVARARKLEVQALFPAHGPILVGQDLMQRLQ